MDSWIISAAVFVYGAVIFAVAAYGESWAAADSRRKLWPIFFTLSIAVYCTSWTFYGAVGTAATAGWDFLSITLGPALVFLLGGRLLVRMARAVMSDHATSIADLISIRYGRSRSIAALVTTIALLSAVPYIALQLKSISMSYAALAGSAGAASASGSSPTVLFAALGLAMFTIIFGARRYEATGRNQGLVLALAFDSAFKLLALVTAAVVAMTMLSNAPAELQHAAGQFASQQFGQSTPGPRFFTVLLLSMFAILCLPRQFYITFVECRDEAHVRASRWPFTLYLMLTAVVVIPITMAGMALLPPGSNPDLFVLQIPLMAQSEFISLFVFLGGFAAAIGMVIASSLALSTMITHDLLTPILLRTHLVDEHTDMGRLLLNVRRLSILGIILLSYLYFRSINATQTLSTIGLVAFAGVAQFAPGLLGSFFWKKAHAQGVRAGLIAGGLIWFYTLFLPSYIGQGVVDGLFNPNIARLLHPQHLLGYGFGDTLTHGSIWSLGANLALFCIMSVAAYSGAGARMRLPRFDLGFSRFRSVRSSGDLLYLAARFVGRDAAERLFRENAHAHRQEFVAQAPVTDAQVKLSERLIAGVIGANSARLILASALSGTRMEVTDIVTVLDETSQELTFSRELLATTLNTISQGVSVVDRDLKIVAWNSRYIELFDFPPGFIRVGKPIDEVIRYNAEKGECGPGEVDAHVARRVDAMRRNQAHSYERIRPNGMVLKTMGNPMPGGGYVTTFTDISMEKAAQAALESSNIELESRVHDRTQALVTEAEKSAALAMQLADANASKTRFLAAASHDLLQPLHAARLFSGALENAAAKSQELSLAPLVRNIDRSIASAEDLIRTLLDISKVDAGGITPSNGPVDVQALCHDLQTQFLPLASERGLRFAMRAPHSLWLMTDATLLRSILQNFLTNAVRYTERGGILLSARARRGHVLLQVWDTGIGIPADKKHIIFDEFQRLPVRFAADKGAGLGLAIVKRLALLLGATISLESREGHGSCFGVSLPLHVQGMSSAANLESPVEQPMPSGRTILCVDDDPVILSAMQSLFDQWGCSMIAARSAEEAREIVRHRHVDIAMVDYHLGAGDTGLDLIQDLRQQYPDLHIALATADFHPATRETASKFGAPVLHKPLHPHVLRAWLNRCLEDAA